MYYFTVHLNGYSDAYLSSSECALAEDLLRSFEDADEDKFQELVSGKRFNHIDAAAGRLVRSLKLGSIASGGEPIPGVIGEKIYDMMKDMDISTITLETYVTDILVSFIYFHSTLRCTNFTFNYNCIDQMIQVIKLR